MNPLPACDCILNGREPVAIYEYSGLKNERLGYIARYDKPGGGKEFRTWVWREGAWRCEGFPKPRPLYGLWRLAGAKPMNPVIVVEGEKCANALAQLIPSYVPISWPNGAASAKHADWSPLAGRTVV
ncbi:MAG: DUF6371 domain-containing protein, partial [bacterium]